PTNYTLYLDLYKENEFAFADKGIAPDDTPTGVSVDFKAGYQWSAPPLTAGQTATVPVTITNLGRGIFPVTNSFPVNLGYHWLSASGQTVVWDGARTKLGADLGPQQSVTVNAQVTAPPRAAAPSCGTAHARSCSRTCRPRAPRSSPRTSCSRPRPGPTCCAGTSCRRASPGSAARASRRSSRPCR